MKVNDLRSALELLKTIPGQYIETDVEADPRAEISGIYRYVGARGTCMRPSPLGPAMVFNKIKGHPGARVAIGVLADRARVAHLLNVTPDKLG
ncbi:MAG: UbiD family decarboxylase, partial [Acidaminococcaceae bacterium]